MPKKSSKKKTKISEPKAFPSGLKLIEVEFDYKCDIGIPGIRPIHVRSKQNFDNMDLASVQLERMQGSISIDTARKSATSNKKEQTQSVKRVPRQTPMMRIGLQGTEPLYYRLNKYTRIVAPSYRTKVRVRIFSASEVHSEIASKALKIFNHFLKAYRVASGDPVPFVNEDENKELGILNFYYTPLPDDGLDIKPEAALDLIIRTKMQFQSGPQMGIGTTEIDMIAKPYIKPVALETVRLALLPEEIKPHAELILEAIERAYRAQDYGIAIVILNTAFEAAITVSLITSLIFLDYSEAEIDKYFAEHPHLEDKRKVVDELRKQACQKYSLPLPKSFRGSGEEGRWNDSTYQKRHWGVHVVRDKNARPLKRKDFEKALKDTQDAIKAIEVPADALKAARDSQKKK